MAQTESPCVRNCCLDQADVCLGCFRHVNEIMRWREMTEHEKRAVVVLTEERRALHRRNYPNSQIIE